jgi:hypothetical protein
MEKKCRQETLRTDSEIHKWFKVDHVAEMKLYEDGLHCEDEEVENSRF